MTDAELEAKYRASIKPCPFCGEAPHILGSGEGFRGLMICCNSDNCPAPSVSYYEHETALAAWNQRKG